MMNIARRWKLTLAWVLSLVAVGSVAAVLTSAQSSRPSSPQSQLPPQLMMLEGTKILSGNDIGFRVERTEDGFPIGRLVVRIDGRWVEAEPSVRVTPTR